MCRLQQPVPEYRSDQTISAAGAGAEPHGEFKRITWPGAGNNDDELAVVEPDYTSFAVMRVSMEYTR